MILLIGVLMNYERFYNAYRVDFPKLSQPEVDGLNYLLNGLDADNSLTTREKAYILATVHHETATQGTDKGYQPVREFRTSNSAELKYGYKTRIGKNLGNILPGDGARYIGRGYVQLTGRANYRNMGQDLGIPLEENPDLALIPEYSYQILVVGMKKGRFTGKALNGARDFVQCRKIINGTDKAGLIAGYAERFLNALEKAQ